MSQRMPYDMVFYNTSIIFNYLIRMDIYDILIYLYRHSVIPSNVLMSNYVYLTKVKFFGYIFIHKRNMYILFLLDLLIGGFAIGIKIPSLSWTHPPSHPNTSYTLISFKNLTRDVWKWQLNKCRSYMTIRWTYYFYFHYCGVRMSGVPSSIIYKNFMNTYLVDETFVYWV